MATKEAVMIYAGTTWGSAVRPTESTASLLSNALVILDLANRLLLVVQLIDIDSAVTDFGQIAPSFSLILISLKSAFSSKGRAQAFSQRIATAIHPMGFGDVNPLIRRHRGLGSPSPVRALRAGEARGH